MSLHGLPDPRDREGPEGARNAELMEKAMAEAASWIARLHGPERTPQMARECREWQARSAVNRLAFEHCTDIWQAVPGVRVAEVYASVADGQRRSRLLFWKIGAAVSLLAVLLTWAGLASYRRYSGSVYATTVGEQQTKVLEDGTRMTLNTSTTVRVSMDRDMRQVTIDGGEAMFEVAKDPGRPFIVRVAGSEVVAVGTVFSVRLAGGGTQVGDTLAVTLIEGKVTVRPAANDAAHGLAPKASIPMISGERVLLAKMPGPIGTVSQRVDRPAVEQAIAWKRSEIVFDDVSLPDAVAEINRYNRSPIVLPADGSLSGLRVSGLFQTSNTAGFAEAVAELHGLVRQERDGHIELSRPPAK